MLTELFVVVLEQLRTMRAFPFEILHALHA
jgi:hypothetical protein